MRVRAWVRRNRLLGVGAGADTGFVRVRACPLPVQRHCGHAGQRRADKRRTRSLLGRTGTGRVRPPPRSPTPLTAQAAPSYQSHFPYMRSCLSIFFPAHSYSPDRSPRCRALAAGRIRGAALDVFTVEPLPQDSPLWARHRATPLRHPTAPPHRDTPWPLAQTAAGVSRLLHTNGLALGFPLCQ